MVQIHDIRPLYFEIINVTFIWHIAPINTCKKKNFYSLMVLHLMKFNQGCPISYILAQL